MHLPEPRMGMGTRGMGGIWDPELNKTRYLDNAEASVDALRFGLSLGLKIIDVSELSADGLTERIVGRAIAGKRSDAYLITKVWRTNLQYDDVITAAHGSLERLNTDYIDLYMVHWPNPEIPLSETMRALEKLVDEKIVRAIGVSNFTPELLSEAQHHLSHTAITAHQFEYNLHARDAEREIIPYCREHTIDMLAYRPFAKGSLVAEADPLIETLAQKYNKTPNQIRLNWIVSQGIIPIPRAFSQDHLRENAGALGWELSRDDIDALRAVA